MCMVLVRENLLKKLKTPWMDGKWAAERVRGVFCSHATYNQCVLLSTIQVLENVINLIFLINTYSITLYQSERKVPTKCSIKLHEDTLNRTPMTFTISTNVEWLGIKGEHYWHNLHVPLNVVYLIVMLCNHLSWQFQK